MASLPFWPFRGRSSAPPVERRRGTLLVADEDPQVRALLDGFLTQLGFDTILVADGVAAIRLLSRSPHLRASDRGHIDLVIADVEITGRSGIDILIAVRSNSWRIPVVLTSAYLPSLLRTEAVRLGAAAVLAKPVSLQELESVVLARLAGRS